MAMKIKDTTSNNMMTEEELEIPEGTEFDVIRALKAALEKSVEISAKEIQITKNGPTAVQFVIPTGVADAATLQCLEESLSDIVYIPDEQNETVGNDGLDSGRKSTNPSNASSARGPAVRQGLVASKQSVLSPAPGGSFFSIPSCTSSFDSHVDPELLKNAEAAITDLENNGPAGIVHLSSLSAAIERPIKIWSSGNANSRKVGRTRTGEAVDIEYHEPNDDEAIGHWTLRENEEPRDVAAELNDCLFAVVADQTNRLAPELRAETLKHMRKHVKSLAKRIEETARRQNCDRISLLIGGARYVGTGPQDAQKVLEKSQYGQGHWNKQPGHPRGHASCPQARGLTESAENYSTTGLKSAFLSRADQDRIAHAVLTTPAAQKAMQALNNGQTNIALHVTPAVLSTSSPQGVEFYQCEQQGPPKEIKEYVIVLRHHAGEVNNPNADVFIVTFYPVVK